jgi:hypothetical protein
MSRLDELKKQYPELNISVFDLMTRLDTSKSYKYLPLLCKIFVKKFSVKEQYSPEHLSNGILDIQSNLINKGISTDGLTNNEMFFLSGYVSEHFSTETFTTLKSFMEYMDKGMIEKNDVTSYKGIDDIRGAVSLASMKEHTKELEGQVIKEYEDEKWLAVRPLTFSASAKYGSSTRWCTTYQKEKNYFEKYWRRGVLVYFINKETGYKFAGYKALVGDPELSFWNAEDNRVDYLEINVDDYLYTIVKKIFKSEDSNKNLCTDEIQNQVHEECLNGYDKMRIEFADVPAPQPIEQPETTMFEPEGMIGEVSERINGDIRGRLIDAIHELDNQVAEMETPSEVGIPENWRNDIPTMRA